MIGVSGVMEDMVSLDLGEEIPAKRLVQKVMQEIVEQESREETGEDRKRVVQPDGDRQDNQEDDKDPQPVDGLYIQFFGVLVMPLMVKYVFLFLGQDQFMHQKPMDAILNKSPAQPPPDK